MPKTATQSNPDLPPSSPLNPQVLGQAENAHRALLSRTLAGRDLNYEQWVAISLTANGAPIDGADLTEKLAATLKVDWPGPRAGPRPHRRRAGSHAMTGEVLLPRPFASEGDR
jgi:hypothetical protein